MNRIPSREQVERLRQRYPAGTRIVLHSMDDAQAPPPGAMGTVVYVDDMGQIGVEWGTTVPPCLLSPVKILFPRSPHRKRKNRNAPVIWSGESEVI